jgi:hypothetical protein
MYKDVDYRKQSTEDVRAILIKNKLALPETEEEPTKEGKIPTRCLQCPFCLEIDKGGNNVGHGNTHHYHLFCRQPKIDRARGRLQYLAEEACEDFWKAVVELVGNGRANAMLEELRLRLQDTEMESVKKMSAQCKAKPRQKNISIIDMEELNSPGREEYRATRERWPLCCAFGFITARREGEVIDATSSAVDLAHLGILSDSLHQWAKDVIIEASKNSGAPGCLPKQIAKGLKEKWTRIEAVIFMKADCLQKVIREVVNGRANHFERQQKRKPKPNRRKKRMLVRTQQKKLPGCQNPHRQNDRVISTHVKVGNVNCIERRMNHFNVNGWRHRQACVPNAPISKRSCAWSQQLRMHSQDGQRR